MKNLITTLVALSLFSFSGCSKTPETVTPASAQPEPQPAAAPEPVIKDLPGLPASCQKWITEPCPDSCFDAGNEKEGCYITKPVIEKSLSNGASANDKNSEGVTALMRAWDTESVKALLAAGADAKIETDLGETALWNALNNPESTELLIKAGANVNAMNDGIPLLNHCKNLDVVKLLIAAGANVNAMDGKVNITPLMTVETPEHAKLLLDAGADVNMVADGGMTPLFNAIHCNNLEMVNMMIAAGANVNEPDVDGMTPLMVVKSLDIAKALVEAKANVKARDGEKKTVLSHISENQNIPDEEREAMIQYLKSKGAKK